MSYNFIGLFLIIVNFFHNIIIKLQEYYITSLLGKNIFASQMIMFHICFYLITQMRTLIDYLSAKEIIIDLLVRHVYMPKHVVHKNLTL